MQPSSRTRRRSAAVLAGLCAALVIGASAASLGGLGGNDLGAASGTVESCDTNGIDVEYRTSFNRAAGEYRLNRVILRNVSEACAGQPYSLTVAEAGVAGAVTTSEGDELELRNVRDVEPGPGVDRAGVARITVRQLVADVDRLALTIGGRTVDP